MFHLSRFKLVICFVLVLSYFFLPKYGFTAFVPTVSHLSSLTSHLFDGSVCGCVIATHFLYPLSHANIFHLLGNLLCLFVIRCHLHLFATYSIAVLCSFLPSFSLYGLLVGQGSALTEPTMGFSGILFAIVGISWGRIHRFRDMILRNKWFLIIPAFIPHINFLIHIYCLLFGYLYGSVCCCATATTTHTSHIKPINPITPTKPCAKKSAN